MEELEDILKRIPAPAFQIGTLSENPLGRAERKSRLPYGVKFPGLTKKTTNMKRALTSIAIAFALAFCANAQELSNFAFGRQKPIVSPEIGTENVIFRLKAPNAKDVRINGSWMDGWGKTEPMTLGADTLWTYTLKTPSPEIYTYSFIVDGVMMNDPQNVLVQRDGSRYLSMLMVPGEKTANYYSAKEKRGTVRYMWYDSGILGLNRRLTVYTPYGYETSPDKKYPVLYLPSRSWR